MEEPDRGQKTGGIPRTPRMQLRLLASRIFTGGSVPSCARINGSGTWTSECGKTPRAARGMMMDDARRLPTAHFPRISGSGSSLGAMAYSTNWRGAVRKDCEKMEMDKRTRQATLIAPPLVARHAPRNRRQRAIPRSNLTCEKLDYQYGSALAWYRCIY